MSQAVKPVEIPRNSSRVKEEINNIQLLHPEWLG